MLKAGIFEKYKPEVAFGLHVWASLNTGTIGYRSGRSWPARKSGTPW
jgi:amidohydrolase